MSIPLRRGEKGSLLSAGDYDRNLPAQSLAELLADSTLFTYAGGVAAGDILRTALDGFRYQVAAAGAADHHLTTGGGVKLYVLPGDDGIYNFKAFNPAANGSTDDYPVLVKAIGAVVSGGGDGASGPAIFFPDAVYKINSTVQIKTAVRLIGNNTGLAWRSNSAQFLFPANTMGFRFNRKDTLDGVVVGSTTGADAASLEGLILTGGGGTDRTRHGIHTNCRIHMSGCWVIGFAGDGVHIEAASDTAVSNPAKYGNANLCQIERTMSDDNGGNGFYIDGYDANACYFHSLSAISNGRWGVWESSFLGNTHIGHHAAFNGLAGRGQNAADQSCYVTYGGNRYAAAYASTEAQLVATTPGTNNAVWQFMKTGGGTTGVPTWTAGKPEGTYFQGGAYRTEGNNARNILLGLYVEGDQGPCQFGAKDIVMGGLVGSAGFSAGGSMDGVNGNVLTSQSFSAWSGGAAITMGSPDAAIEALFQFTHSFDGSNTWRFQRVGLDWVLRNQNLRVAMYLTGVNTAAAFGTSAPIPYIMGFPVLGLGSSTNARRQTTGTVAPTTGDWAKGDIVWNAAAAAGGFAGWICTTAGTPGTWKTFGAISA